MPLTPIVSSNDGPRLTVNQMLKSPTLIPRRMLRMLDQQFLADAILRNAGTTQSGAVVYEETAPQFADDEPEVIEEFAEIPATVGQVGTPKVVKADYRGLAVKVSERMRTRNQVDAMNRQMTQVRNTMVRHFEDRFLDMFLTNPSVQTYTGGDWNTASTRINDDLAEGALLVSEAAPDGRPQDFLGYSADTLIISQRIAVDFIKNDTIQAMYVGNIADESIRYRLVMPGRWGPYSVVISRRLTLKAPGKVILLERNTVGGIVDERPLRATPMYQDRPRETWRSDLTRASAMFLDNPKAAVIIDVETT